MGIRTPDLLIANETLYQLSYTPNSLITRNLYTRLGSSCGYLSISSVCTKIDAVRKSGIHSAAKRNTSQLLRSIPNVPCLKRHEINGNYYAVKKIRGKIKTHAFRSESGITIRDRKLAERKLREWLDGLEREELSPAPKISFRELLEKYRAVNAGKSSKSKGNIEWAINTLRKSWKQGFDIPVATILASDASSWLAQQKNLKPNSYNELSRQLKNIFKLALNDRVISRSPYDGVTNKRKRVAKEPNAISSAKQFEIIVGAIRDQRFFGSRARQRRFGIFLGTCCPRASGGTTIQVEGL
jgi:hypothetical protein